MGRQFVLIVIRVMRTVLAAALMVSIGAHWALLQGVAWVGMAVTYSVERGSLMEGLEMTFDGDHPCPMCKAVKKGTESEKKNPRLKEQQQKLELFASASPLMIFIAPPTSGPDFMYERFTPSFAFEPSVPPPRCGRA